MNAWLVGSLLLLPVLAPAQDSYRATNGRADAKAAPAPKGSAGKRVASSRAAAGRGGGVLKALLGSRGDDGGHGEHGGHGGSGGSGGSGGTGSGGTGGSGDQSSPPPWATTKGAFIRTEGQGYKTAEATDIPPRKLSSVEGGATPLGGSRRKLQGAPGISAVLNAPPDKLPPCSPGIGSCGASGGNSITPNDGGASGPTPVLGSASNDDFGL